MDFENICPIADTVIDLPVRDKRALLHDLGHRAALVLKVDGAIGNLEQYSLSAISVLAERAVAALVPR